MVGTKVQVASITLANNTPIQTQSFLIDTNSDYKFVSGFYIIRNSGSDYLRVSVYDAAGNEILAPVNIIHLTVGNTVSIKEKFFLETPFKAEGTKIKVNIQNFSLANGIQDCDFVMLLDNTHKHLQKKHNESAHTHAQHH